MQNQWNSELGVSRKIGTGTSFGTFGELLQGVSADNDVDFLVTLPIERYSVVEFSPDFSGVLKVIPEYKQKSAKLAIRLLKYFDFPLGGTLYIKSDLPTGKGLASSSADLVATARAIEASYDINISVSLLQRFMGEIEPTDGVMYSEVVSFYHRKVELGDKFGSIPNLSIVAIDEGGEVDTIEFNKSYKSFTIEEKLEYATLVKRLKIAFQEQDVRTIGEISTRSAIMNQSRQEKRSLNHFLKLSNQFGALGVVVAHSGTYIGLLLWQEEQEYQNKLVRLIGELQKTYYQVHVFRVLSNKNDIFFDSKS